MATKAIHKLGDISRGEADLCHVYDQDDYNFYGTWITGFGFFDVKFPKETTRELTDKEVEYYSTKSIRINNQPAMKLNIK